MPIRLSDHQSLAVDNAAWSRTRGRPRSCHYGHQGARGWRAGRAAQATAGAPWRSRACAGWAFRRPHRPLCRHETARAHRGAADDLGWLAADDVGGRFGRGGLVEIATGIATGVCVTGWLGVDYAERASARSARNVGLCVTAWTAWYELVRP